MPTLRQRLSAWLALRPQPPVPWKGFDVLAGLAFALIFCPVFASWVLEATHFFQHYYGTDVIRIVRDRLAEQGVELARARWGMWVNSVALPLQVIGLPLLFYGLNGYRPEQLGLTLRRFWRNLGLGLLAAVVLTPLVLGINYAVSLAFQRWTSVPIEQHPFLQLSEGLQPLEKVVLVFAVVVAAPLVEELLTRGLLQSWFASRPWGGHLAMAAALFLALQKRSDGILEAWRGSDRIALLGELLPALFVLCLVPGYLVVWRRSRTPTGPALFGTALLFAAAHSAVWPTPVALFVLGLGLGYLYLQTQSLVAPVVVHALFNSVGCVQLLWRLGLPS
jgi:membrane protease YdiL (CAAX protease family)